MPIPGECTHYRTTEGPRVPLRYGSSATEICLLCGQWRQAVGNKSWRSEPLDSNRYEDEP